MQLHKVNFQKHFFHINTWTKIKIMIACKIVAKSVSTISINDFTFFNHIFLIEKLLNAFAFVGHLKKSDLVLIYDILQNVWPISASSLSYMKICKSLNKIGI